MSTGGAQLPPSAQSSSATGRLVPRNASSKIRFIRSWIETRSRNGSQRTIAISVSSSCEIPSGTSVVLHRVLGIDHVALARALLAVGGRAACLGSGRRAAGLPVQLLRQLVALLGQLLDRRPDHAGVLGAGGLARLSHRLLDRLRLRLAELGAVVLEQLLDVVGEAVRLVAQL